MYPINYQSAYNLIPATSGQRRSKWETTPDYSKLAPGFTKVYETNGKFSKDPLISSEWWDPTKARSVSEESKAIQKKIHSPDVFYYTLNITNNTLGQAPLSINQNLSQPLIDNPEDYEMSIVRFTVPGNDLPIFKFKYQEVDGKDIYDGTYTMSIVYNNAGTLVTYFDQLNYIPSASNRDGNNGSIDYNVYDYNTMVKMMNNCLSDLFDAFDGDFKQANRNKPYITFNPVTQLMSFNVNNYWNTSAIDPTNLLANGNIPPIANGEAQIWISIGMANYLRGFNLFYCINAYIDNLNPKLAADYLINFIDIGGDPNAAPSNTIVAVPQQYKTLGSWNDVRSIVITTNSLPIIKEQFPLVSTTLNNRDPLMADINVAGSYNTSNVISDFIVTNNGPDLFQTLEYLPTAEYRMMSLTGSAPIRGIDLIFQWIGNDNSFNQLYLDAGQSATVKMMFRKKKNCC